MKANRKSLNRDDEAVSPVIAVILMVAITVVLAATVYVWVSGFGSSSNSSPAHTMSLVSAGAISYDDAETIYWKNYTVSSADASLTYGDIKITLGGLAGTFDATGCSVSPTSATVPQWGACAGTTERAADAAVTAGDKFTIACFAAAAGTDCLANKDFLILDNEANSVMVTLKVR